MIKCLGYSQKPSTTAIPTSVPADTITTELLLNPTMDTLNSGYWTSKDYKLYIKLEDYEKYLHNEYSSLLQAMQCDLKNDSVNTIHYKLYAARFLQAINQINTTKGGFDLRQLAVYVGTENTQRNNGNSAEVELYVRGELEKGNAAVFYRGQRIYKLNKRTISDVVLSTIKIYFDDVENFVFSYFGYIHW